MKELLEQLKGVREEITVKKQYLGEAKEREELIKQAIINKMHDQELESARFNNVTTTLQYRYTLKVIDEKKLVKYLKSMNLTDYISERPNELFEVYRKEAERQEKVVPGTEMQETEYLNVRERKNDIQSN